MDEALALTRFRTLFPCSALYTGFAGVYFEKMLKGEVAGIWIMNIQLAFYGVIISLVGLTYSHREESAFRALACLPHMACYPLLTCACLNSHHPRVPPRLHRIGIHCSHSAGLRLLFIVFYHWQL